MVSLGFLEQVDIFYQLNNEQLQKIANICQEKTFDVGTVIFEDNSVSDEMYIIANGAVAIQVNPEVLGMESSGDVASHTVSTLRRGQTFGEVALVDEGVRSASAKCLVEGTKLLVIKRKDLIDLSEDDFRLGYILMRNVAADLAFKVRGADLMVREHLLWKPRR